MEGGAQLTAVAVKVVQKILYLLFAASSVGIYWRRQDTPPLSAPPSGKADESAPRDYGRPIPSRMAIPDDYERENNDDDNDDKDKKIEGGDILVVEAV